MIKKLNALALGLGAALPAFSAPININFAVAAMQAIQEDLILTGSALLGVVLLVFPVRFVARLFRG